MKRMVLMLALVTIAGLALANPLESIFMSRFWFDAEGHLNVLYSDHIYLMGEVDLFDGTNHFIRTVNPDNPSTYTQVYPDANCSPLQGSLQMSYGYDQPPYLTEEVTWGDGLDHDLSPLLPGQCGQQFYLSDGDENTIKFWAKDLLANPGGIYGPLARCELHVYCHNEIGTPVAGVPIYILNSYNPSGISGADGWFNANVICTRLSVVARGPVTNSILFSDTFFTEPGQSYTLDVLVDGTGVEDPGERYPLGKLTAYPSILRNSSDSSLHLEYDGKTETDAYYALYDLKGREVATQAYHGELSTWQIPKLSSGVYFISLKDKHRILATRKLIVLK